MEGAFSAGENEMFIVRFVASEDCTGDTVKDSVIVGGDSIPDAESYFWGSHAINGLSNVQILAIEPAN